MICRLLTLVVLCGFGSLAQARSIDLQSAPTTCESNSPVGTDFDCFVALAFEVEPGQTDLLLHPGGTLTVFRDSLPWFSQQVWTEPLFVYPGVDAGNCSELCFSYSTDAAGNLLDFNITYAFTGSQLMIGAGMWGVSVYALDGAPHILGDGFHMRGDWTNLTAFTTPTAPAPVPLPGSGIGMAGALLGGGVLRHLIRRRRSA